ncbi:unnamed protein product [Diamesa serratosioi]
MIHDILLSLLSDSESSIITELLTLEISSDFFHPAEIKTLQDISKISNKYKEIRKFISKYNNCSHDNESQSILENEQQLPAGLYLQAFADGLEKVIESFRMKVVDLETKYLKKSNYTLMFIYHELEKFRPLFEFLLRLINGIKTQKLFGCCILQYLQENSLHGNQIMMDAVLIIQKSVYTIFIQQLCQWIMYGQFVDIYNEFFIQHVENNRLNYNRMNSVQTTTFQSSEPSIISDLWHYEISYNMLPHYFNKNWAEKVLFIGQTVLMFNSDPREVLKTKLWNSDQVDNVEEQEIPRTKHIWGNQEYEFYRKFHELQQHDKLSVVTFEKIIEEVKINVTEHLSDIAINEADLLKQLKYIKDFFLLGRGELFFEFIKSIETIYSPVITDGTIRDVNRAFQVAATSVNVGEEVDLFSLHMNKEEIDSLSYDARGFFSFVTMKYKIQWPLHLLFAPKILDRYNELFRFLIRIKKIQYDLHKIWSFHRENKVHRSSELLQFRNKLMFLIDNLQYYLQVDVLESQFSILMCKIEDSKDFEHIQRAHTIFQANILGLCFLLENQMDETKSGIISTTENPVLTVLNKIIQLVEQFSCFAYICSNPLTDKDRQSFDAFESTFSTLVNSLLKMLSGLQASAPLAQFLLRLDFNYWFSTQNKLKN